MSDNYTFTSPCFFTYTESESGVVETKSSELVLHPSFKTIMMEFLYLISTLESLHYVHICTLVHSIAAVLSHFHKTEMNPYTIKHHVMAEGEHLIVLDKDSMIQFKSESTIELLSAYKIHILGLDIQAIYKKHFYTSRLLLYTNSRSILLDDV